MKTLRLLSPIIFLLTSAFARPNSVPFISQPLIPTTVKPGSPQFMLTVNGTGFSSGALVTWNGGTRITNFVSSTQVQAQINAEDVAQSGTALISFVNPAPGGGVSNTVLF